MGKFFYEMFTIFHSDDKNGLDNGLYLSWHVRPDDNALVYYPSLQPYYERGPSEPTRVFMLARLASFLPKIGFQDEIVFPLNEGVVILPEELKAGNSGIEVMFVSEFQAKFKPLYCFLQEKIVTHR